jgi:hypothetical protein
VAQLWQPTTFRRYIRAVGGSTAPVRIATDAGDAFIKAINNPVGPHALAREWVATNLIMDRLYAACWPEQLPLQ